MIEFFSAFLIGLVSAGHCLGMCGGLMLAAGLNSQNRTLVTFYNLGRVSTYLLLTLVFGLFFEFLPSSSLPILKAISGFLILFIALYYLGVSKLISKLDNLGLPLWKKVQPLSKRLLPVKKANTAYGLGMLWGLIPCGLVYSALAFSLTGGSLLKSLLLMLSFAVGTLPAMVSSALFAQQIRGILNVRFVKVFLGITMIGLAFTLWFDLFTQLRST